MHPVVLITGSASGVGRQLTGRFLQEGYQVLATDIDYQGLKQAAKQDGWRTDNLWLRKLDIAKQAQWQKLWQDLLDKWQRIDVLCNIAAYLKPGRIHQTAWQEVDRHVQINIAGLIYGSKLAAETMTEQGRGQIINIASLAGIAPIPGIALYSSSKFAVRGFSLALAQELKPLGVAVSVICPDAIETPMLHLQEDYEEAALTFSGGKILTVQDIESAVFDKALRQKRIEIMLPATRGWLAKLGGAVPSLAFVLSDLLNGKGKAQQARRKGTTHSRSVRT
ncbi:MAG: SDR family oxidoreductase [Oleiphilaceae bacterium]|nr:SDR family oxidoreductase [Oleiphilaceae bacterium]